MDYATEGFDREGRPMHYGPGGWTLVQPTYVAIDDYIGPFKAHATGEHWNGWECPTFDFDTACDIALGIMAGTPDMLPGFAAYDPDTDTFWLSLNGDIASIAEVNDEYDEYTRDATGRYPIGTHGWCWQVVDIEHMADMLADDIRDNVTSEDWATIQSDIARDPHDIRFPIDTNECMVAVWEAYFGRVPDASSEHDSAVWNAVWSAAVARPLLYAY